MNPIYLLTSGGVLVAFGPGLVLFPKAGWVMVGNTNGESGWEAILCAPETPKASEVIFQFALAMKVSPAGSVLCWDEAEGAVKSLELGDRP
jgi:hypothetical protein